MKTMAPDNTFFVLRNKISRLYVKKSTSRSWNDNYTNKLGQAAIFASRAVAENAYNPKQVRNVEVVCMFANEFECRCEIPKDESTSV